MRAVAADCSEVEVEADDEGGGSALAPAVAAGRRMEIAWNQAKKFLRRCAGTAP